MFDRILNAIKGSSNDNGGLSRRRFPRRITDTCVVEIANKTLPIKDWSQSGVLIQMDSRAYHTGQTMMLTLKFRVSDSIEEIAIQGEIVRKNDNLIAFNFINITPQIKAQFTKIIDAALAEDLTSNQMA